MKKTLISLAMALFLCFSIFLTGCKKEEGLKNNPSTTATVISNGGMSVIKGDYLYFVNGYVDETTLEKKDNKLGEVKKGAIYRTKLDDGEISKDKDGFLNNKDCVVSKVVGFSNGGFYIVDDYIIYATPHMGLDSTTGTLQNNRVEFHRININGTKDETLFTTSQSEDNLDWAIYKVDKSIFLVLHEGEKLISVNVNTGNVVKTIENVTSYALIHNDNFNSASTGFNSSNVYYTRKVEDEDNRSNYSGNVLCSFNVASGEITKHIINKTYTFTIKNVNKDTLYYTYEKDEQTCLYKRTIKDNFALSTEMRLTNKGYSSYNFVDYGVDLVLASDDNGVWLLEGGANPSQVLTAKRDVLAVFGNYGYYTSEGTLIRFDIRTGELQDAYTSEKSTLITNSKYLDFDNRRVYLYVEYTAENSDKNYYLNYFEENYEGKDIEQRFVGDFEEDDLPALPEQPEPEYEGQEVEYIPHID